MHLAFGRRPAKCNFDPVESSQQILPTWFTHWKIRGAHSGLDTLNLGLMHELVDDSLLNRVLFPLFSFCLLCDFNSRCLPR